MQVKLVSDQFKCVDILRIFPHPHDWDSFESLRIFEAVRHTEWRDYVKIQVIEAAFRQTLECGGSTPPSIRLKWRLPKFKTAIIKSR
ncbi:MAG: hypothetical protein JWM11_4487 [Planctomycetaceae bacterium]|nr:hypothetical protein [Planctomycetaceae bacterium]